MIKVIVFDAQGTLFSSISKSEKIGNILQSQGYKKDPIEIDRAFLLSKRIANLLHSKGLIKLDDAGYLLENEIRLILLGFTDKEAIPLAKVVNEQWTKASKRTPYLETKKVLDVLSRKYKIGLLTAGAILSYKDTLEETGLAKYFSFVIGEDTTNVSKPDPRAYMYVIDKAGCKADEILFVGDDFINDYEGPTKHGMRAVLVDREHRCDKKILKIKDLTMLLNDEFFSRL
ncbi:HAD family hydrolase [Candidatus Marsarchaeota archaeon]|jgi:HAD superfamily hydrolase (TIGR01549 family)|nr:HAD family hydrolase [Candidatus Marsarchaeota archaeon]